MSGEAQDKQEAMLGLRIMTALHQRQMSVYALAKGAGIPLKTTQRICKGEGKQPSVWTIAAIARVLGVTVDYLVGLDETASLADVTPAPTRRRGRPSKAAALGVTLP